MSADLDQFYMLKALKMAEKGRYTTAPNPIVGAVIVKNNEIIATGFHEKAGEPHAEVNALKQAQLAAKDATLYVTLEPCNHFGKTPPCTDAVIQAGIKRVVIGQEDSNPRVNGSGIKKLREHGIEVKVGVLQEQAFEQNRGFFKRMQQQMPWVRLKMGMTLDGKTADFNHESKWITGEAARKDVQLWRARSDAMITGVNTIVQDDPDLTLRDNKILNLRKKLAVALQPLLVVCDTHLKTPKEAKIFNTERAVWLATAKQAIGFNAEVKLFPLRQEKIDLHALLKALAQHGCNDVLVEAGSLLAGAFLEADLVDELILYYAPKVLGEAGRSAFHFASGKKINEMKAFTLHSVKKIGGDVRMILRKEGN